MRKKNEIRRFTRFCFSKLNLRPIEIKYVNYKRLIDPDGEYCFGCFTWNEERPAYESKIYLAYHLPKFAVMINAAHEIWHYSQVAYGTMQKMSIEECEQDAEKGSHALITEWLERGGYLAKIF